MIKNEKLKVKLINFSMIFVIFIFYFLIYILKINIGCVFNKLTGFYCPACGMSRAFGEIFKFNFVNAVKLNILSIPLCIFILVSIIWSIVDIFMGNSSYIKNITRFFKKYCVAILLLLVIAMIVNNIML